LRSEQSHKGTDPPKAEPTGADSERPDLNDPLAVLALLETDQVVAEKRRTRFGHRNFSLSLRALLWGLRVYVVVMLVIVVIAVVRAVHALQ
jgi:hypothetical protein